MMKKLDIKDIAKLLENTTTSNISTNLLKIDDNIYGNSISTTSENSENSGNTDISDNNMSLILSNVNRSETPDNRKLSFNKNPTITPILKFNKPDFTNIPINKKSLIIEDNLNINNIKTDSPILSNSINSFSRTNSNENNIKYNIDEDDEEFDKKDPLIRKILKYKEKLNKNLFILSVKYDRICYKYNTISLTIMILSTISTFIEATRLTMTEYLRNNENTLIIDVDIFTLSINILMLVMGTVITILSSIVRFKNYREIMEKLKNYQNIIVKYKILYDKQIDIIKNFKYNNRELDDDSFNELNNKLKEYNKEVNENINLIEDIRNDDKIKLQQFKHTFDIQLDKMKQERNIKLLINKNESDIKRIILNNKKDLELMKINNKKNKKSFKYINIDNNEYENDSKKRNRQDGSIVTMANFDIVSTV